MRFARRGREGLTERFVGAALLNTYLCTRSYGGLGAREFAPRLPARGENERGGSTQLPILLRRCGF
jgi:hypothetical protein